MDATAKDFSPIAGHPPAIEVEFKRAKPLFKIGAYFAFMLLLLSWILSSIPRIAPGLLPPRLAGLGYAQDIQGRVDSALVQQNGGLLSPAGSICAVVGFSGGQEGIDLQQLSDEDKREVRYLGLCGACDGTMTGLSKLVAPLLESDLEVDSMVMAINPFHLVVRPFTPSLQRSDIKYGADLRLLAGRREVLRLFGLDADPRYRTVDPWRPMTKNYFGIVSEQAMAMRLDQYRNRGYADLSNYDVNGQQGSCLHRMISEMQARNAYVTIVLMPVHPALFRQLPRMATAKLGAIVSDLKVPILDYQQAIDRDGFYDVSHLNNRGRREFTALLAPDLGVNFNPQK
jgi:hypothetical protein